MKTATRILHGSGVHIRVLFTYFPVLWRKMRTEKAMKTNAFNDRPEGVSSLDLGRAVHSVAAPFLSQNQKLTKCGRAWSKQAVHGFCTLLAPAAIPIHNPT